MKNIFILFVFIVSTTHGQLTIKRAQDSLRKCHISTYSYHEEFIGHADYGAPLILTNDGGAAAFGHGDEGAGLTKLDSAGRKQWTKFFKPQFTELELQSVIQDVYGNYFVCMQSHDEKRYPGGSERLVCLDKNGKILWDKMLGNYTLINSPTISYLRELKDGRIELRGHIVKDKPVKGKDPQFNFWQGWIDAKGVYTQKIGDIIDWNNQDWKNFYKVE